MMIRRIKRAKEMTMKSQIQNVDQNFSDKGSVIIKNIWFLFLKTIILRKKNINMNQDIFMQQKDLETQMENF